MDRYLAELKAEADSLYENTEVYGIADYIITYNNGIVTCPVLFLQQKAERIRNYEQYFRIHQSELLRPE